MSSIMVTLTTRSDSYFERSNISFFENNLDGVELNSNCLDDRVRKNGQKILWFSADRSQRVNNDEWNKLPINVAKSLELLRKLKIYFQTYWALYTITHGLLYPFYYHYIIMMYGRKGRFIL